MMGLPRVRFPETVWGQQGWFFILVTLTLAGSCAFACALPFAALAAVAALMLPRSAVLGVMVMAWALNQVVGFVYLGYPQDAATFLWVPLIGAAALCSGWMAHYGAHARRHASHALRMTGACVGAVLGFQAVLLLANLTPLGGLDHFAFSVKIRILLIDAAAFALLYAATLVAGRLRWFATPAAVRASSVVRD